jgi:poly(hydroxyalkanoate) granule-associated protein
MVSKQKPGAGQQADSSIPPGLLDGSVAKAIRDSAQQIWLAGLGAYAKAQDEGGKVFDTLIKEGASLQRKTRGLAEERLGEVSSRVSGLAEEVTARAGQQWDKLESIFDERVAKSLQRLGVPSAKDLAELSARIDALNLAVAKRSGTAARTPAVSKKTSAKKKGAAPAKKAAVKRPARKTVA